MDKTLIFKKDGEILHVKTKAENISINGTNVKDKIDIMDKQIQELKVNGGNSSSDSIESHREQINSEDGAHNLRYYNNILAIKEDDQWKEIEFNADSEINKTHRKSSINSEDGIHNIRYYDDKLSFKNEDGEWEDINVQSNVDTLKLPPTKFIEILSNDTSATIKWEDADDQTLNDTIISTWAGTKLLKKVDSPPLNELDGEILVDNTERDYYKLNGFVDENVLNDTVYYYALFPYNTEGVYNYDIANIRKFYRKGEDVPLNTTNISVISSIKCIKIRFEDGKSTSDALWAGTKVVRKVGAPPATETDGVIILDNTNRDKYKNTYFVDDTATQDVEYFYGFFPYSREGHYNTNIENVASAKPATGKIYTLSINMDNSSPSGACTYLDDAVNLGVGDSWDKTDIFQMKPCVFKNGRVNYYLNKNDYTKKIDGTPSNLSGVDGDVMVEIPFICYRITRSGNTLTISLSTDKNLINSDLNYKCYAFYDTEDKIADKIYVGVYQGYIDSGNLYSNSGKTVNDSTKYSLNQIFDACKARGKDYLPYSFSIHQLFALLYMIRFRTRNVTDFLCNNNSTAKHETGAFNENGMWYKSDGGKLAGIEWGVTNSYLYLAGVRLQSEVTSSYYSQHCIIMHPKNYYTINIAQTSYLNKFRYSYYNRTSGASNSNYDGYGGYTRYVNAHDSIIFPSANQSGASSTTYFCSYMSISGYSANREAIFYNHMTAGPHKALLNYYETSCSSDFMTRANYATYLTYIKAGDE